MADGKVTITVDLDGSDAQAGVKSLKSALLGLGDSSSSGFGKGTKSATMFGLAAGAASAIVQKGMAVVSNSISGAVSRVDTMNRFPKTMALFGYSAEQSRGAIDKLSRGIEGLPTTLDSAVSSAQQLTITTGDLDKGTDLALAFNNAMIGYGATTEGAEQALRQFNQSLGSGKIQAEEFNSVSEAAPGLMSKMAEAFGFGKNGVQDLKAALSEGKITASDFADKMIELNGAQGGFAEMAQASAGGIRTSFQNVQNAVTKGVANMITKFDELAKAKGLGTISENLNKLKGVINDVFENSTPAIETFVDILVGVVDKAKLMWEAFQNTGAVTAIVGAFDAIKGAIGHVFDSLGNNSALFETLGTALGEVVKWLAEGVRVGADFISSLPPGTIQAIAGAVLGAVAAFKGFKTVTGIIKGVSSAFGLVKAVLAANPFALAVAGIGALVGAFVVAYNSSETFRAKVDAVVKSVQNFIKGLDVNQLKSWAAVLASVAGGFAIFKMLNGWNPFKAFGKNGKGAIDAVGDALDTTSGKSRKAKGIITQVFTGLGNLIKSAGQGISTAVKGIGTGLSTAFKGLGTGIATAAKGIGTAISTIAQGFGKAAAMANPAQWLSMGAAMLLVGTGVAIAAAGISLLVQAAIQLADAGTGAQLALVGLGIGIATLVGIFALLGPMLTAGAVGIVAFGAAVALIGVGVAIAAAGLAALVNAFANAEGAIAATGQAISTAAQGIGQGLESALNGAAQVVESCGEAIKSALEGVAKVIESVGKSIESAFKGIGSVIESIGGAIKGVLDGVAGVIESVGKSALNAGKGFDLLANGVVKITNTKLADMAASLGAVATGVGAIAAQSGGLASAGSGMKNLGTGMSVVSKSSSSAVAGLTSFASQISSLSSTITTLPSVLTSAASGFASFSSQAQAGVTGLSAINAPIATFKAQLMSIGPTLAMVSATFASFGASAMVIGTTLMSVGVSFTSLNAAITSVVATLAMVSSALIQVGTSATTASSQIRNIATSTKSVISAFSSMASQVQSSMQSMLNVVKSVGNQMKSQGRQIGQQTARNIAQGISSGAGQASSAMNSLMSAVRSAGMAGVGGMRAIGAMIGQGLAAGMMSALGAVTAAANALVAQAERAAQAKAKIHSPSRLFRDNVGRFISQGVAVGIESDAYKVDEAMGSMYEQIQAFNFKAEDVLGVGKSKYSKVVQVQSDLERAVKVTVEVAKEKSNRLLEQALNVAERAVSRPVDMRLDDGTLVAKTGAKFSEFQSEQSRRYNRMRGILE